MKGSEKFKQAIELYLAKRAATDELFAKTLLKENKNIDDCVTYILNTVKNSGINGFEDDEIYNMAVHYYDEDNIDVGKPMDRAQVIVNHHIELTEAEKAEARQKAIDDLRDQHKKAFSKKPEAPKAKEEVVQTSLFG